jgi:alkanesulfonate monooxygenase SsuD/methylene tetrahydromethanopterin reductase-like flavin-dependent oxidoreductase (luciferase family)
MIKRFHALYVGQIALDNIGIDGTPANDRRYSNERLSEVFWTSRDVAQLMDELGYYCFWTAEHHFQREGYECLPNLIQLGLWLATQTKRLKFGCAFNILPMWHPIRLAEDYAMADIVTDGRIVMGVGPAITPAKWKPSAPRCSIPTPTGRSSRKVSTSC